MMKKSIMRFLAVAASAFVLTAMAQVNSLSSDQTDACEALVCLSSPHRPSECTRSLQRYFSIRFKNWSDTTRAREDFLKLCPKTQDDKNKEAAK